MNENECARLKVDLPNGAYVLPGGFECDGLYKFILYVHDGMGGLTNVFREDDAELQRRLSISQEQIAAEVRDDWRIRHTSYFLNEPNLPKLIEKLKEQRKMPKFKDGWYRVQGEPGNAKGQRRHVAAGGNMTPNVHHHYIIGVKGGELKCLLPMGDYTGSYTEEQMNAQVGSYLNGSSVYGEKYIRMCEKAWGVKNILELVPELAPISNATKATGAGLLLLFAGGILGRMAKNRAKARAAAENQKQNHEQKEEAPADVSR